MRVSLISWSLQNFLLSHTGIQSWDFDLEMRKCIGQIRRILVFTVKARPCQDNLSRVTLPVASDGCELHKRFVRKHLMDKKDAGDYTAHS